MKEKQKHKEQASHLIAKNIPFDLRTIEKFTAGVVLSGNEIKSVRLRDVSIKEAYILIRNREVFIINMHIAPYKNASAQLGGVVDSRIKRKLLLRRSEINKLAKLVKEKGCVALPVLFFISQQGWGKIELVAGQKLRKYQLKNKVKEREIKRKIQQKDFF